MTDTRAEKLAELVLDYSIETKKDDRLFIQFDPAYAEYATMIGNKARKKGAEVRYDSMSLDPQVLRGFIKRNDINEWQEELERRKDLASWCNSRILIDCDSNPNYAKGIPNAEVKSTDFNKKVIGPYKDVLYRPGKNRGYEIDYATTIEDAYDQLNSILGSDGVQRLTSDTQNLMKQQMQLAEAMKNMEPMVQSIAPMVKNLQGMMGQMGDGKEGLNGLMDLAKKFAGQAAPAK